ncbi:MAG: orotate phosphoribosyltransferase, partial [Lautropia sp.]|nr:orotate phosphoribosyltransferase [Lautropia sp.]
APLKGRVAIIDDVISAGTSVRESVEIIRAAGATPAAVFIAIDRMERGGNAEVVAELSAVEEVRQQYGLEVFALATLDDLLGYLSAQNNGDATLATYRSAISDYRRRYGSQQTS